MLAAETEFNEKMLRTACVRLEGLQWQMQMAGTYAMRLQETLAAALAVRAANVQSASSVVDQALALPLPGVRLPSPRLPPVASDTSDAGAIDHGRASRHPMEQWRWVHRTLCLHSGIPGFPPRGCCRRFRRDDPGPIQDSCEQFLCT